ncbi:MAG: hypothetical protein R6U00_11330, partial [Prochlorococcaceae cyanobacterium]
MLKVLGDTLVLTAQGQIGDLASGDHLEVEAREGVQAEDEGDIALDAPDGDLRIDRITTPGDAWLSALSSVLSTNTTEASLAINVDSDDLRLETTVGGIGSVDQDLITQTSGRVDIDSNGSLYLTETSDSLGLGVVAAGGRSGSDQALAFIT